MNITALQYALAALFVSFVGSVVVILFGGLIITNMIDVLPFSTTALANTYGTYLKNNGPGQVFGIAAWIAVIVMIGTYILYRKYV